MEFAADRRGRDVRATDRILKPEWRSRSPPGLHTLTVAFLTLPSHAVTVQHPAPGMHGRDPVPSAGRRLPLFGAVSRRALVCTRASALNWRTEANWTNGMLAQSVSKEDLLRLREALDQVSYGILLLDADFRAQFINRAFRGIWALPDEVADANPTFAELLEHGFRTTNSNLSPEALDEYVAGRLEHLCSGEGEARELRLGDGRVLRFEATVLRSGGRMVSYADVTDQVRAAEELQRLSSTDELTGLWNRRHFFGHAHRELERFQRYGRPLSVCMLDVDRFKSVNDRFGHAAGDAVPQ